MMKLNEVSLLRGWLAMTAVIVVSFLVWNFAPILIPFAAVFVVLAGLTAMINGLARHFQKPRDGE